MGILDQTSNFQNSLKNTNKIPDYARDYRNEYLFIRGIDKKCGEFKKKLSREDLFKSSQANSLMRNFNRFLKAQELEYLNDTSEIKLKYKDVISIESLKTQLDDYIDVFDYEENDYLEYTYTGFNKFFECFSRFMVKINLDEMSEYDYYASLVSDSDSDDEIDYRYSDSDIDSDSDEYKNEFYEILSKILND